MEQITHNDFKPYLNDTFRIEVAPSALMDVDLVSVDSFGNSLDHDQREAFALVFRSQQNEELLQRSYVVSHPEMGDIEAFLVAVGKDDAGVRYEAVFT